MLSNDGDDTSHRGKIILELMEDLEGSLRVEHCLKGGQLSQLVKPGDFLMSVDGVEVTGHAIDEVKSLLSGEVGQLRDLCFGRLMTEDGLRQIKTFHVKPFITATEFQDIQAAVLTRVMTILTASNVTHLREVQMQTPRTKEMSLWKEVFETIMELREKTNEVQQLKALVEGNRTKIRQHQQVAEEKQHEAEKFNSLAQQQKKAHESLVDQLKSQFVDMRADLVQKTQELDAVHSQLKVKTRESSRQIQDLQTQLATLEIRHKDREVLLKKKEEAVAQAKHGVLKDMYKIAGTSEENQRLNAEFVAALSFSVNLSAELLWNKDQKWRLKTAILQAARRATECSENRIEVIGMRPGSKRNIQIDIHILPQVFAPPNEFPSYDLALELIRQVRTHPFCKFKNQHSQPLESMADYSGAVELLSMSPNFRLASLGNLNKMPHLNISDCQTSVLLNDDASQEH